MKQFTLDTTNDMVAGVCGGLAKYFGVDVVLVRVGFVFATFLTGYAILLYIILGIVTPNDFDIEPKRSAGPGNDNI